MRPTRRIVLHARRASVAVALIAAIMLATVLGAAAGKPMSSLCCPEGSVPTCWCAPGLHAPEPPCPEPYTEWEAGTMTLCVVWEGD